MNFRSYFLKATFDLGAAAYLALAGCGPYAKPSPTPTPSETGIYGPVQVDPKFRSTVSVSPVPIGRWLYCENLRGAYPTATMHRIIGRNLNSAVEESPEIKDAAAHLLYFSEPGGGYNFTLVLSGEVGQEKAAEYMETVKSRACDEPEQ